MKVLHITAKDRGGAGIAAIRLHQALLESGVSSKVLCLQQSQNDLEEVYALYDTRSRLIRRMLRKVGLIRNAFRRHQRAMAGRQGNYEVFSFPITDHDLLSHPLVKEADIINLHWVANLLDWKTFFKGIHKSVIWTLHDMNPFQGGFHYADDVVLNKESFGDLETRYRQVKHAALAQFTQMTVVGLTEWLMNASQESEVLGRYPHLLIRNSLDLAVFKPLPKDLARQVWDLPMDKIILVFVSETTDNRRKGLDLLQEALQLLPKSANVLPVAIGKKPPNEEQFPDIHFLGPIYEERLMALAYAAADAFVIPSREDNLPNVMLESLACGRPVIGFPIGGVKEIIQTGKNGVLAEEVSGPSLATAITKFIAIRENLHEEQIRAFAEEQFTPDRQARAYIELYREKLS